MPLTVIQCPDCDAKLKAKAPSAPRKVRCPKCGSVFQVGLDDEPDAAEEEAPRKTTARTARRRQDDDDTDQEEPPRKSRRRQDDDDDQAESRSRRRQAEDEEEDEDDEAPRRAATIQLWLGVGSLSLAAVVLLAVWIPAFSSIAMPLSGVALALGVIGLALAIIKGVGHGFPIAGCEVSGIALVVSVLWILIMPEVRRSIRESPFAERPQNRNRMRDFGGQEQNPFGKGEPGDGLVDPVDGPPTKVAGSLTLTGGTGELTGQLAANDPRDRALEGSPCKVYTVSMTAGKTYQIDMISTVFDAYLRLEDPGGKNLAEDDDGGEELDARIVFTCRRDGRYRIVATTVDGTGPFILRVQEK